MKEMVKRVREEKDGFTIAELLIVVAIVAVLVAIAIPVFTSSLNKATSGNRRGELPDRITPSRLVEYMNDTTRTISADDLDCEPVTVPIRRRKSFIPLKGQARSR